MVSRYSDCLRAGRSGDRIPVGARFSAPGRFGRFDIQPRICMRNTLNTVGRDSPICIATCYGLDGPGSNHGKGEIFRALPERPWGPLSLLYNGYWVFPGGKAAGAWR